MITGLQRPSALTYLLTYLHTYIHTYILTYLLTKVDEERAAAGLSPLAEVRASRLENAAVLARVEEERARKGLIPIRQMREEGNEPETLLVQQKSDVIVALSKQSRPLPYIVAALEELRELQSVPYAICTASSASRVTTCLEAMPEFGSLLPTSVLNSGESNFTPHAHKPQPWVYLRGAAMLGVAPERCVAVEDSETGVGAGVNAKLGLVIGYVGGLHAASPLLMTRP